MTTLCKADTCRRYSGNNKAHITFLLVLLTMTLILWTGGSEAQESGNGAVALSNISELETILQNKREFYNQSFPEIQFIILQAEQSWIEDIMTLGVFLGHEPVSLDYEHPPKLRDDLMFVSIARIREMLINKMPSASLFRADEPLGWRENVCVLTLDPQVIARDDIAATYFLLDLGEQALSQIPTSSHCDKLEFLEFVFDHEAFHCLDSFYNGPQPMSDLDDWEYYYHFRNENGADAFAIAMHIKRHSAVTEFITTLRQIRGVSLLSGQSSHWTHEVIQKISYQDPDILASFDPMKIFQLATEMRDKIVPSYNDYLQYQQAANQAMRKLNIQVEFPDLKEQPEQIIDQDLVDDMLRISESYYFDLTGEPFINNR